MNAVMAKAIKEKFPGVYPLWVDAPEEGEDFEAVDESMMDVAHAYEVLIGNGGKPFLHLVDIKYFDQGRPVTGGGVVIYGNIPMPSPSAPMKNVFIVLP